MHQKLRSDKIPRNGVGFSDKGFYNADIFFAWINQGMCPLILRNI